MEQNQRQQALGSGYSDASTATELIKGIDLTGKIAIVTGGNTGIGLETTTVLAGAGATVIVPVRNVDKSRKNLEGIANVEIAPMDLMDSESITNFAKHFLASCRPLHLLINNAGIMWVPLRRDARGYESQLVTNYLAQFQLTALLFPALQQAKGARVINVSSQGHQFAPFHFEDPNFQNREYETLQAYGQSKTAVNLFSVALDDRAKAYGVRSFALHPGSIYGTELAREASPALFQEMGFCDEQGEIKPEVMASLKTIPQGAATTIWAATSSLLNDKGGLYCEDCDIAEINDSTNFGSGVRSYAVDMENANRLWTLSEELTGIEFSL